MIIFEWLAIKRMHNFEDDDYSNTWCSISQDMHTQQPQLAMPIAGRAASRLATHRRWLIGAAATATSSAGVGAVKKAQMGELRAIAVNDVYHAIEFRTRMSDRCKHSHTCTALAAQSIP
jgi:hypothetical protein